MLSVLNASSLTRFQVIHHNLLSQHSHQALAEVEDVALQAVLLLLSKIPPLPTQGRHRCLAQHHLQVSPIVSLSKLILPQTWVIA